MRSTSVSPLLSSLVLLWVSHYTEHCEHQVESDPRDSRRKPRSG